MSRPNKAACLSGIGALLIATGFLGTSCQPMNGGTAGPVNAADDSALLSELPANLRAAGKFDSTLKKQHDALARRRTVSPQETIVVRSEASGKLQEINGWINLLSASDAALGRAISSGTATASPYLGTWLSQRNQGRARIDSLRTYQTWFGFLAS